MHGLKWAWIALIACCTAAALGMTIDRTTSLSVPPGAASITGDAWDWQKPQQFWSFKPIMRPSVPEVRGLAWARNPIDKFVLARLQKEGIQPAPEADRLTLLRRATFDLTGLPPTPQEIRAYLADHSGDAYEKVIDRLLASPHYGERWGRHWLDVARYVQGRITFPGVKNTLGDQAFRDYVVRAFNEDKAYNQFATEQLAGDLLPPGKDPKQEFDQIAAPAFLSLGAWFDQCTDPNRLRLEMVDDMVNTTSRAFLGLTVSCARCHDHKFDPIPTSDYYALGGIFASTKVVGDFSEYWRDGRQRMLRPLAMPEQVAANDAILKTIAARKAGQWKFLSELHAKLMAQWRADEPGYRAAAMQLPKPFIRRFAAEDFQGQHNLRISQLALDGHSVDVIETLTPTDQWVKYLVEVPRAGRYQLEALYSAGEPTPLTATVNSEVASHEALGQPTGGWELIHQKWSPVFTANLRPGINFIRLETKHGSFPRLDRFRLCAVDEPGDAAIKQAAISAGLDFRVLAAFVKDPQQPWPTIAGIVPYLDVAQQNMVDKAGQEIAATEATLKPYQTVVSVTDQPVPADLPVHIRGEVYSISNSPNPRGTLRLLNHDLPPPAIPAGASGRLQLAGWITDSRNPLTSRVMVNRLWQWHFGRGIVATPGDFGSRGDPPTHPELLDWLAAEFIHSGWSIKHMQKLIMVSSTYRMSSNRADEIATRDPDNKLLSHFNRNRLEVEALYDAMASTTNIIVRQESGQSLDVEKDKNRAMYVLACNRSPKGLGQEVRKMFELFDYDSSGAPISLRLQSTTPAQSLFWLNSPLVEHFADKFAQRLLKMDRLNDDKRVEMAYLLALGRSPSKQETSDALEYLTACATSQKMDREEAWTSLCHALYGTVEFRYVE